ncbi:MAG TPA: alcohol dehydrogenase catalytic domain-containing protein [Clostridia bacterium]|nr:alcohol dehydrogenase catalytic domain-containing protein [Clostridia bacterium]
MMNAIVKIGPEAGAVYKKVDMPKNKSDEILLKVKAAAICGTDIHIHDWNSWAEGVGMNIPSVMGHECSGEIVAVGENVKNLKVGDYVAVETHIPCGECYQCENGEQHICQNLKMFGIHTNGCFAEYAAVPAIVARKISKDIRPEVGAMLEPLGVGFRAGIEMQVSGKRVAVIGCGPIGLLAIASIKALGASEIYAVDIIEERLELSEDVGATHHFNSKEVDVVDEIMKVTGGVGVDAFIDASGNVHAINQGFKFLRKGGQVGLAGLPSKPISLDLASDVVFKEAKITGFHGRKMFETWTKMVNMLSNNSLYVDPVVTHVMPLEKYHEAVELLKAGKGSKIILVP